MRKDIIITVIIIAAVSIIIFGLYLGGFTNPYRAY
ncbi:hypothetical protein ACVWYG_002569 [Pedobacter sp. UYEF25]